MKVTKNYLRRIIVESINEEYERIGLLRRIKNFIAGRPKLESLLYTNYFIGHPNDSHKDFPGIELKASEFMEELSRMAKQISLAVRANNPGKISDEKFQFEEANKIGRPYIEGYAQRFKKVVNGKQALSNEEISKFVETFVNLLKYPSLSDLLKKREYDLIGMDADIPATASKGLKVLNRRAKDRQ